jgi:hypothetical protein
VVSQHSMSFKDYLDCRLYNLTVAVFYNEEVLRELINFVKFKDISPSVWIDYVCSRILNMDNKISVLFSNFLSLTEAELYSTSTSIERAFSEDERFRDDILNGRIGYNLLLDTQGEILISHFQELVGIACDLVIDLFKDFQTPLDKAEIAELHQIGEYVSMKRQNIFNVSEDFVKSFDSTIVRFLSPREVEGVDSKEFKVRFFYARERAKLILDQVRIYGTNREGIGKIIARSPIKDFQRNVEVLS